MFKANNIKRLLALAIVLATVSVIIAITVKSRQGKVSEGKIPHLPGGVDVALDKVHYTEIKDGRKKWDLLADNAAFDKRTDVVHLTGVRLLVAGSGKSGDIALTADLADYNAKSKDVRLTGNVVAKSASGMKFTTKCAVYSAERSMIKSLDRIRFTDGKLMVEGVGMEFMTATRTVRIMDDVTAVVDSGVSR